ncbi:hypothetical protein D3C75_1224970 [compost metagenome]
MMTFTALAAVPAAPAVVINNPKLANTQMTIVMPLLAFFDLIIADRLLNLKFLMFSLLHNETFLIR